MREAVRALLSELPEAPGPQPSGRVLRPPPGLARPMWGPEEDDRDHHLAYDPRSPWGDEGEDERWPEDDPDDTPPPAPTRLPLDPTPPRSLRWLSALAAGWRAALWWLRRQSGRRPLSTALGVGLAAGAVALAPGPLAGVVGTALGLVALADAARCAVSALAGALGP